MRDILTLVDRHGTRAFLTEKGQTYSYADLRKTIEYQISKISPSNNDIVFVLESENSLLYYGKFLALLVTAQPVMLLSGFHFNDSTYRADLKREISHSSLIFIGKDQNLDGPLDAIHGEKVQNEEINSGRSLKIPQFVVRTSGSSGFKHKFVLHNADNFFRKYELIGLHFSKTFAFSPAESIAGVETLLETVFHGASLVSAGDGYNPEIICKALVDHGVDYFQTTPSFLSLLLISNQINRLMNSNIKKIAYGSEPANREFLKSVQNKLPTVEMMHTYGMTEIGILHTITPQNEPHLFQLNSELNPYVIHNQQLKVKSLSTMLTYLNYPYSKSEWFETGDIVEANGDFMRILGRTGDLINVAGQKFYPSEAEELLLAMPEIRDVAVSKEPNPIIGNSVIVTIYVDESVSEDTFRPKFKSFCETNLPVYMRPQRILITREPPVNSRFKKVRRP